MEPVHDCIVILGDINRGLRFFGPYESYVEACEEAKSAKERWNVVPLHPPFWNCTEENKGMSEQRVTLFVDPNAKLGAANTSCPPQITVKVKDGEVTEARLGGFVYRVEADCKAVCVESTKDSTSYEIDLPPITSKGETDGES